MVFRGSGARLKYEFVVHPGADPAAIRLSYQGASSLTLGAGGEMRIGTPLGTLRDAPPRSWQRSRSGRAPVSSRYAIEGRRYGFEVGAYDRARTLVIDPGLEYSTRLGPSGTDAAAVAADEHGHAYVVGASSSPAYPTTPGAFETEADRFGVGFVTKLSANGSDLVYSTYLGSGITGMALDAHGNVFVVGFARNDFPTTAGAYRETTTKPTDSFVAKLDATGSTLVYGTFLGASYLGGSAAASIAVDEAGAAYITGGTSSADYPLTPGAFDSTLDHQPEGAVAKLDPAGSSLVYSTFYGGAYSNAIAVDGEGNAYVTGSSPSPQDFPTTEAAFDRSPNGGWDTFVTKFSPEGSLVYSTLLGDSTMTGATESRSTAWATRTSPARLAGASPSPRGRSTPPGLGADSLRSSCPPDRSCLMRPALEAPSGGTSRTRSPSTGMALRT